MDGIIHFHRLYPGAPAVKRAERSADGMLPTRGYRYCEALAAASAFGFYIFPPINFGLVFDGTETHWAPEGAAKWQPLRTAVFPGGLVEGVEPVPSFLAAAREPGVVQIWSGYVAETNPGWSLLIRGLANTPRHQPFEHYEGIIESEAWFGPLFTNIRLTKTDSPVNFHQRYPLFQVQPLLRECYGQVAFASTDGLSAADRQRFAETMAPSLDPCRRLGHYGAEVRRKARK